MDKIVEVGTQKWTAEPIRLVQFLNGDSIPEVISNMEWQEAWLNKRPAWCYYENDMTNEASYGKLYNRYVLQDERGIAPEGWRLPTYSDFIELGSVIHQESLKRNVLSISMLDFGFINLLGGKRIVSGQFFNKKKAGHFWSSTERDPVSGCGHSLKVITDSFMGCDTSGFLNGEGHSVIFIKTT